MKERTTSFPSPIVKNSDGSFYYKDNAQYQAAAAKYIEENRLTAEQVRVAYLKLLNQVGRCQ